MSNVVIGSRVDNSVRFCGHGIEDFRLRLKTRKANMQTTQMLWIPKEFYCDEVGPDNKKCLLMIFLN